LRPSANLRVLHAPTDKGKKGTHYIVAAIEALQAQGCAIELVLAQGVSPQELRQLALDCDIAVDQLMAGVYGTFSAEMMALGLPVIARISSVFQRDYPDDLPIISAGPDDIDAVLKRCLNGQIDLANIGVASQGYAARVHDHHRVAAILSTLY
jgi:hypothetical protein